jgi:uncharacterized protein (TIGR03382 family)
MTSTMTSGGSSGSSGGSTGQSDSTGATSTGADTDSGGSTTEPVEACPAVYAPVCGKDGETYDNACTVPEGVEIRREGPCLGDCEGSCTVVGSPPVSMGLALLVLLVLRGRRRI